MGDEQPGGGTQELPPEAAITLASLGIDPDVVTEENVAQVLLGLAQFTFAEQAAAAVSDASRELGGTYARSQQGRGEAGAKVELAWISLAGVAVVVFGLLAGVALFLAARSPGGNVGDATEPIALIALVLGAGGVVVGGRVRRG